MGDLFAPTHLLLILLIVLIIFGPSKLKDVGGALGTSIRDFKRAMNDPESEAQTPPKVADSGASATVEVKPDKPV